MTGAFLAVILGASLVDATEHAAECQDKEFVRRTADVIVEGVVSKVEVTEDKGGMIWTTVSVDVSRALKGKPGKRLKIRELGGTLNGRTVGDGEGPWSPKIGDEGFLYLSKPSKTFQGGKYHTRFCGYGLEPRAKPAGYIR